MAGELIYLDTSGILAFLDADDTCHAEAARAWGDVVEEGAGFVMTDYVRLECWSLVQRRLGLPAVEDFRESILPLCEIQSVGETGFSLLTRQVLLGRLRDLSLVDLSSFECMQRMGLKRALAFDRHFVDRGYITPETPGWRSA